MCRTGILQDTKRVNLMYWFAVCRILLLATQLQSAVPVERAGGDQEQPWLQLGLRSARLQSLMLDDNVEQDEVRKRLLNTDVSGTQSTRTRTRLRVIPGTRPLKFELETTGEVVSETLGLNAQAVINSSGQHQFEVLKPLWFDGSRFRTQKCYGTIQASQWPQGVSSTAGRRAPALAPLGDRLAWNQVLLMQPRINRAVAQDLSRDVLPKIDKRVEARFAELQDRWLGLQSEVGRCLPDLRVQWSACATDAEVQLSAWTVIEPAQVAGAAVRVRESEDVALCVSQSALGAVLNAVLDRELERSGGRVMTDSRLQGFRRVLQSSLSPPGAGEAVGESAGESGDLGATLYSVEFAERESVVVDCTGGVLKVQLRLRIVPRAGLPSDWMLVGLSLRGEICGEGLWRVRVSGVEVSGGSDGWQRLLRGVLEELSGRQVGLEQPREYRLSGFPDVFLYLRQIESGGGVLRVSGVLRQRQTGL